MPPYSTRSTSILEFDQAVLLYSDLFDGAINEKMCLCSAVSTGMIQEIDNNSVSVLLNIWVTERLSPIQQVFVQIPKSWTPRIFLACILLTLRNDRSLLLRQAGRFAKVNEVEELFQLYPDVRKLEQFLKRNYFYHYVE